jgi:perosamine synthetase
MTSIEGGMLFTEDDDKAAHIRMMRNQGEDPKQKYIHPVLGTNARMTDMQAAIALRQLDKFEAILKRRAEIARYYYDRFAGNPGITLPKVRPGATCAWFFAPILVENRDAVAKALKEAGVDTRVAYPMPVYEQPFYRRYAAPGPAPDCPNAKRMTQRVLNLPMFHGITEEQLAYVADKTLEAVERRA